MLWLLLEILIALGIVAFAVWAIWPKKRKETVPKKPQGNISSDDTLKVSNDEKGK